MKSLYHDRIGAQCGEHDPRHVEAYMRLAYSTLDGLSLEQFHAEVALGVRCIEYDGRENAECLARSFGL